jgi:hypothetical protein
MQDDTVLLVPLERGHRQLISVTMIEKLRQANAVVGRAWFFTEHNDPETLV